MGPQVNALYLYVEPGLLAGVCTFAAGDYTFDVVPEVPLATDEVPGAAAGTSVRQVRGGCGARPS